MTTEVLDHRNGVIKNLLALLPSNIVARLDFDDAACVAELRQVFYKFGFIPSWATEVLAPKLFDQRAASDALRLCFEYILSSSALGEDINKTSDDLVEILTTSDDSDPLHERLIGALQTLFFLRPPLQQPLIGAHQPLFIPDRESSAAKKHLVSLLKAGEIGSDARSYLKTTVKRRLDVLFQECVVKVRSLILSHSFAFRSCLTTHHPPLSATAGA